VKNPLARASPRVPIDREQYSIAGMMAQRGHGGRVIDKVIGANFYRVMEAVW